MIRKFLCLVLCAVLFLSLFSGCAPAQPTETTTPAPTQPPEEEKVLKVLSIGNSHSEDSMWLFQEVLRTEMPELEVMIVELVYSAAMPEHLSNATDGVAVYSYCVNTDGEWVITENYTVEQALKAEMWDYVIINESSRYLGLEHMMNKGVLESFVRYIQGQMENPFRLIYNWTWSAPTDEAFYAPTWEPQPPGTFRQVFTRDYGFDREQHYNKMQKMILKYVQPNENFYEIYHSATAIQYATEVMKVPQTELYRDYTHLSDYGRLYIGYLFYAQIMDLESISEVNVDVIPAKLRHWRYKKAGDVTLTDQQKHWIVDAVNYTLKNPLQMPEA